MKIKIIILMLIVNSILLMGCELDENKSTYVNTLNNGGAYKTESIDDEVAEENKPNEYLKLISVYVFNAESDNLKESLILLDDKIHELNGYISSHDVKASVDNDNKKAVISFKVPRIKIKEINTFIKNNFDIVAESSETINVALDYNNNKADITSLENKEIKMMDLYSKTINLEDLILIEDKLAEINREKEALQIKYNEYQNKESYVSVNLTINEVKLITDSNYEKITNAFNSSVENFKSLIVNILVFFASSVHLIIIFFIGFVFYKKSFSISITEKDQDSKPEIKIKKDKE